ncbi:MAG: hypothetical protein N2747_08470 [Chitinophagaceae bacterium]|nr:hypothetical protein [Chitinophagaceae bacterium]
MKFITATILTGLLSFISGIFLPWWGIAPSALLVAALIHQKAGKAFLSGFAGVFLLWAGLSFWIDIKNNSLLSRKIAEILPLGGNSLLLILLTALVGGLAGGLGALTGSYLRASPKRKQ